MISRIEQGTIITRCIYCEDCDAHNRYLFGVKFITYGGTSKKYYIMTSKTYGKRGMSPHLIQVIRNEEGGVLCQTTCAVDGCGVSIKSDTFATVRRHVQIIPFKEFEALENRWKDTGYEI